MSQDKPFIIFIDKSKPNTAFHNRFLGIYKMLLSEFQVVYVRPKIRDSIRIKIIRGFINRMIVIWEVFVQLYKNRNIKNKVLYWGKIDILFLPFILSLAKLFKTKIVSEVNEYPLKVIKGGKENKFISYLEKNAVDGYTFISDSLIEYYRKYLRNGVKYLKLPMTVDEERFKDIPHEDSNYIFYAGSLSNEKDGVLHLINSFASIRFQCHYCLKIAGMGTVQELNEVKKLISEYSLEDRVDLLGFVDKNSIPQLLTHASILVIPRPDSIQARGGFPSKLGEYLMAKKPVICTRIGELESYLSEEDVYFISSDSIEKELSERIIQIEKDYIKALQIAQNGFKKCWDNFTLQSNTLNLTNFISGLFAKEYT